MFLVVECDRVTSGGRRLNKKGVIVGDDEDNSDRVFYKVEYVLKKRQVFSSVYYTFW